MNCINLCDSGIQSIRYRIIEKGIYRKPKIQVDEPAVQWSARMSVCRNDEQDTGRTLSTA
jgi:hypothetical protein